MGICIICLYIHCVPKSSTPAHMDNFVNCEQIFKTLSLANFLENLWQNYSSRSHHHTQSKFSRESASERILKIRWELTKCCYELAYYFFGTQCGICMALHRICNSARTITELFFLNFIIIIAFQRSRQSLTNITNFMLIGFLIIASSRVR